MTSLLCLLQAGAQTAPPPLFTNDMTGFAKILSLLVVVVLLPIASLVVYFLKRGPDAAIKEVKSDLNQVGTKVNAMESRLAATDERVSGLYAQIAGSQSDIMRAIQASSEAQIRAVHIVEIEVARLQERSNFGDCLATFGASIERLANAVASRDS